VSPTHKSLALARTARLQARRLATAQDAIDVAEETWQPDATAQARERPVELWSPPWAPCVLFGRRFGRVPRKLRRRAARWLAHVGLPPSTLRPFSRTLAVPPLSVPVTGAW